MMLNGGLPGTLCLHRAPSLQYLMLTHPVCLPCPLPLQAHPFDTEEGRAALTSPFAAGAFQAGQNSGSCSDDASAPAAGPAAQERSRRGPHDSAGTTHSSSAVSGASSHRSFLAARCARIETKSIHLGHPLADAGIAAGGVGGAEAAAPAPAPPPPEGELALEMQPVPAGASSPGARGRRLPGLSAREVEQRHLVGAMLSEAGVPRRVSDETVRLCACPA